MAKSAYGVKDPKEWDTKNFNRNENVLLVGNVEVGNASRAIGERVQTLGTLLDDYQDEDDDAEKARLEREIKQQLHAIEGKLATIKTTNSSFKIGNLADVTDLVKNAKKVGA